MHSQTCRDMASGPARTDTVSREMVAARALLRSGRRESEDVLEVVAARMLVDLDRLTPAAAPGTARVRQPRVVVRKHRRREEAALKP